MVGEVLSLEDEDLIEETDVLITLSNKGYIKRLDQDEFRAQKRGGRGVQGTGVKDDDFVKDLVSSSTHDRLLFFTNKGRVYRLKAYEIQEYGRTAKGLPIVNLLKLRIMSLFKPLSMSVVRKMKISIYFLRPVKCRQENRCFRIWQYSSEWSIQALNLKEDDELITVFLTDGQSDIIMGTRLGYSVRFNEGSCPKHGPYCNRCSRCQLT